MLNESNTGIESNGKSSRDLDDDEDGRKRDLRMDHILDIYDFDPSVKTKDLENLFHSFRESGVNIRWINNTRALAVFSSSETGGSTSVLIKK